MTAATTRDPKPRRKHLKWGETPWDKLSREELLRTVQRYHSALSSLDSCLSMSRATSPT